LPELAAAGLIAGMAPLIHDGWPAAARVGYAVRSGMVLGLAAALPLAPWLLKSLIMFGTPFYPTGVAVTESAAPVNPALGSTTGGTVSHFAHIQSIVDTLGTTYWHYVTPLSPLLFLAPFVLRRRVGGVALMVILACAVISLLFVPLYLPPRYWLGLIALSDAVTAAVFAALCSRLKHQAGRLLFGVLLTLNTTLWLAAVPLGPTSVDGLIAAGTGEVVVLVVMVILQLRLPRRALLEFPVVALLCLGTLISIFVNLRDSTKYQYFAVAVGSVSREAYVTRNNWYYPAIEWANRNLPRNAKIVLVNLVAGYYVDPEYLDDWYNIRIIALEAGPATRRAQLATWCGSGIRYAIFDSGMYLDNPHAYRWTHTPGLASRLLFTANRVQVLALTPCGAVNQVRVP
jgi:hypothetical protein